MKQARRWFAGFASLVVATALGGLSAPAWSAADADTYPSRPVKLVMPNAAPWTFWSSWEWRIQSFPLRSKR